MILAHHDIHHYKIYSINNCKVRIYFLNYLLGYLYLYGKGVKKDIQHAEKCYLLQVKCYPEEEAPIQNLAHFYHEIGDSTKYKHWSQEQQKIDSIKGYVSERKIDDNIYIKTYKKTHERQ